MARGISATIFFLVLTILMLWARSHRPEDSIAARGTVLRVLDNGIQADTSPIVRLRLDDGREALVTVPIYVAREGLDVPLVLEPMKDGPDLVRFDEARWLDNGGR
jgi:hypothetical protein